MTGIIAMRRADLVDAVTEAVLPLKARIDALAAELAEVKLQRDSWKRIAERGLGITAETVCDHQWQTAGFHLNEYCGKCFVSKLKGEDHAP